MSDGDTDKNQEFVANGVLLFFTAALGIGIALLAVAEFGAIPFELDGMDDATTGEISEMEDEFFSELAFEMTTYSLILAPLFGAVVGLWGGGSFQNSNEGVFLAAVAGLIGGFIFVMIVGSLSFVAISDEFKELAQITSLSFSNLLVNALFSAIGTAVVSAGSAYAAT